MPVIEALLPERSFKAIDTLAQSSHLYRQVFAMDCFYIQICAYVRTRPRSNKNVRISL